MIFDMTKRKSGGGGGYTLNDLLDRTIPSGDVVDDRNSAATYSLAYKTGITNLTVSEAAEISNNYCINCSNINSIMLSKATKLNDSAFAYTQVKYVVAPKLGWINGNWHFRSNSSLLSVDFGGAPSTYGFNGGNTFNGCSALKTIVLRADAVWKLNATSIFSATPFASGGSGGTIYIPKSLYDHLGDGTASDYKAATNWSTVNGYGTITWAKIEGSIYENAYADGTPIPSA